MRLQDHFLPVYSYHPEITSWHKYKVLFVVWHFWSYLGDIREKLWDGRKNVCSLAKVLRSPTNLAFARKHLRSLCNNIVLPWETLHSLNSPPRNFVQNICILLQQYCIPWEMLRSLAKHCVLSQNDWSPENLCILLQIFFMWYFYFFAKLLHFPTVSLLSHNFCEEDAKTFKYIFSSHVPLRHWSQTQFLEGHLHSLAPTSSKSHLLGSF